MGTSGNKRPLCCLKVVPFLFQIFAHGSVVSHNIAVWLTVFLCVARCLLLMNTKGKYYTSMRNTVIVICFIALFCTLTMIPSFMTLSPHLYNIGKYTSKDSM